MATRSPLLRVSGKVGNYFGKKDVPVTGSGVITKSHGHYMLKAAITPKQARDAAGLEEMKKKVPAEQEARTRAKAGFEMVDKGGEWTVPRHGTDAIPLSRTVDGERNLTYAGHAYMQTRQSGDDDFAKILREEGNRLVDPHAPKRPVQRDGEPDD